MLTTYQPRDKNVLILLSKNIEYYALHIKFQYSFTGTATDIPLMDWLQYNTFPSESKFSEVDHAGNVYPQLVRRLLQNGTTTVVFYATIHVDAT